eukprot:2472261-Prymnesium_polylepis.1
MAPRRALVFTMPAGDTDVRRACGLARLAAHECTALCSCYGAGPREMKVVARPSRKLNPAVRRPDVAGGGHPRAAPPPDRMGFAVAPWTGHVEWARLADEEHAILVRTAMFGSCGVCRVLLFRAFARASVV